MTTCHSTKEKTFERIDRMATSISVKVPTTNSLHQSLSFDDQDQYYNTNNDDSLCMEYLNEVSINHKSSTKYVMTLFFLSPMKLSSRDGVHRSNTDQQAIQARPPPTTVTTKSNISPYLQKLPHSNFIQTILPPSSCTQQQEQQQQQQRRQRRRRRRSTSATRTRDELLDSAYQPSNVDHLDLSSFFGMSQHSFGRPTSAPTRTYVLHRMNILSLFVRTFVFSMMTSAKKKRTRTPLHKSGSKGQAFLVTVYRNGDHEKSCYCKANSLNAVKNSLFLITPH